MASSGFFNLVQLLKLILEMLKLVKDSDQDGRPDVFDSEPDNPNVK